MKRNPLCLCEGEVAWKRGKGTLKFFKAIISLKAKYRERIYGLCRGRGKERIQEKIRTTIPAGVKNGMQIKIPLKNRDLKRHNLIATLLVLQ